MNATKLLVKKILESPFEHKWSLQGLGMLRLYLNKETRLHIWDSRFKVPNVSTIHDHPWDFDSLVVAGRLKQVRFYPYEAGERYSYSILKCGAGNCERTPPLPIWLNAMAEEDFGEGDSYRQVSCEIHDSRPYDGTVTIIERKFTKADEDHARVFWKEGDWVSAEPRPATKDEIKSITTASLATWFNP